MSSIGAALAEVNNSFTKYHNNTNGIDSSWEGASRDNLNKVSQEFVSAYKGVINQQMTSFETALELCEKLKELKEKLKQLEAAYQAALANEDYEAAAAIAAQIEQVKREIEQLIKQLTELAQSITNALIPEAASLAGSASNGAAGSSSGGGKSSTMSTSGKAYPVDEFGIVIKNDGVPRNGTAQEKQKYLFPNGRPSSDAEARKYIIETEVDYIDANGERKKTAVRCHKALEEDVQEIFSKIADTGFKLKPSVYGNQSLIESYYYKDNGTSEHCLGAAVDLNPGDNPYTTVSRDSGSGASYNPANNEYAVTEEVANIFRSYGWSWGGADWTSNQNGSRYDYMHFDFTELGPQTQK